MKRFFLIVFMTTLSVTWLVGWFAPDMITWYFSPPVDFVMTCKPAVSWGIETYRRTLLYGTVIGFVLGVIFGLLLLRRHKPATPPAAPTPPAKA